ncbi:hypothetical protein [Myxococcus sp. RHSTA-1-4]|uniref:hypothetical protein n=1 Tax=Myxococcus sp. RHSTA-1-4 TaxID=2874601 RepID=UPI001CC0039B|nr:hypothetical protein [Myxococcus sp. RHSTA-1-4]
MQLGVHHDTVRRALALERVSGTGMQSVRPTLLDPYKNFIQTTLEAHPRLTASRLFHMVKARGYSGGPLQVRRYVRTVRPESQAEAFLRRTTLPGEEAQVDLRPLRQGGRGWHEEDALLLRAGAGP